jgi:hypothetical protein
MHNEYGYIGYPGLLSAIRIRVWWLMIRSDIKVMTYKCPNCQVLQGLKKGLECKEQFHIVKKGIQLFK